MRCFLQQLVEPSSESILGADRSKTGQSVAVELAPNCLAIELNVEIAPGNFKMSASSVEPKLSSFVKTSILRDGLAIPPKHTWWSLCC
jgi:hypothetical protein